MLKINQLTVKSKLTILLVAVSFGSLVVVSLLAWSKARATLKENIFNQLTSVRSSKAYQIESYFNILRNHVETLCEDRMVVAAMVELNKGFKPLNYEYIKNEWNEAIEKYYTNEFFPRLSKTIEGTPNFQSYAPESQAAKYLQYYYLAKNSNPVGEKDKLVDAKDGSKYSKYHADYHEIFRNMIKKFGYNNLFLIDFKTGDIVYTVYKETDFGTNLTEGPYRQSNLAAVVDAVRKNPERGAIQLVDFDFYRPSYGKPAAFIAGPIYNGPHIVGILAIQLPVDEINNVLTGNRNWERDGLGKSGETYLVGADFRMRSISRFLIEDAEGYKKALRSKSTPESTVSAIEHLGTSILLQKVDTESARQAIAGSKSTTNADDYRGHPSLSSYSPLSIKGVNWAIITEIDIAEAYQSVYDLERYLLIATVILILLVTYLAGIAAGFFVTPIATMIKVGRQVSAGKLDTELQLNSNDEFGELARTFNEMLQSLRNQTESIAQKDRENEALLLNVLPSQVAERLKKGEYPIADNFPQVTVLFASVLGLAEIAAQKDVRETAEMLNELVNSFDEEADRHDVEKVKTMGDRYIAVCGLSSPRLDRDKRMVDFALHMLDILERCNNKYKTKLCLGIGIHTGAVMAGIVGTKKFTYDLWGETVNIANHLNAQAEPDTIVVTEAIYDRVREVYSFEKGKEIEFERKGKLATWVLRKKGLKGIMSERAIEDMQENSEVRIGQNALSSRNDMDSQEPIDEKGDSRASNV